MSVSDTPLERRHQPWSICSRNDKALAPMAYEIRAGRAEWREILGNGDLDDAGLGDVGQFVGMARLR